MSLETILNLTWLSLSIVLMLVLGISDGQGREAAGFSRSRRLATFLLIALFAFPCISATDDLWSFRGLPESQKALQSRGAEDGQRNLWRLAHLFESLQTLTFPGPLVVSAWFCFLGLASSGSEPAWRWSSLCRAGRSPPLLGSRA